MQENSQQEKINLLKMEKTKIEIDFRKYCEGQEINWYESTWPEKQELTLKVKDILEPEVDEKYYLKDYQVQLLIKSNWRSKTELQGDICKTIQSRDYKDPKIIQLNEPNHSNNRVYSEEGISPTLNTMNGGNRQPFIQVTNATKLGYLMAKEGDGISLEHPNSTTRRGRVQEQMAPTLQCNDSKGVCVPVLTPERMEKRQNGRRFKTDGEPMFTLNTQDKHGIYDGLTIRKLTPIECFKLMGFLNNEINLDGLSDTQRYKLAGNGWDINLISKIFIAWFDL